MTDRRTLEGVWVDYPSAKLASKWGISNINLDPAECALCQAGAWTLGLAYLPCLPAYDKMVAKEQVQVADHR